MPPAPPASKSLAAWPAPAATQVSTGRIAGLARRGSGQQAAGRAVAAWHCAGWLACCCRALLCCPPPPTNPPASRSPCLPTCLPACRWLPGVPPCQALQAGAGVPHLPGCVGRGLHPVLHRRHLQGLPLRVLPGCRQALPSVRRRRLQRVQPRWLLPGGLLFYRFTASQLCARPCISSQPATPPSHITVLWLRCLAAPLCCSARPAARAVGTPARPATLPQASAPAARLAQP